MRLSDLLEGGEDSLAEKVRAALRTRYGVVKRASLMIKAIFVVGAGSVSTLAQFTQFPTNAPPSGWQIAGIVSSLLILFGGIFVLWTEEDASKELLLAHEALDQANALLSSFDELDEAEREQLRLVNLYQAVNVMRGGIERSAEAGISDEDAAARLTLEVSQRLLPIAMGFAQSDQWTITLYRSVPTGEPGRVELRCVKSHRAIPCEAHEARVWQEGTGIAGVAYSNRKEVIVPDLQAEGMQAVFGTAANVPRDYDNDRYRSMAAVPIMIGSSAIPWGVVAATSDQPWHFSAKKRGGVRPEETVRALAGMVALSVSVARSNAPDRVAGVVTADS